MSDTTSSYGDPVEEPAVPDDVVGHAEAGLADAEAAGRVAVGDEPVDGAAAESGRADSAPVVNSTPEESTLENSTPEKETVVEQPVEAAQAPVGDAEEFTTAADYEAAYRGSDDETLVVAPIATAAPVADSTPVVPVVAAAAPVAQPIFVQAPRHRACAATVPPRGPSASSRHCRSPSSTSPHGSDSAPWPAMSRPTTPATRSWAHWAPGRSG